MERGRSPLRLFTARVEYEFVVVAKDDRHAERVATDTMTDFSFDDPPGVTVSPVRRYSQLNADSPWLLPEGYEEDTLPWGNDPTEKTIGEYLKEQEDADGKGVATTGDRQDSPPKASS